MNEETLGNTIRGRYKTNIGAPAVGTPVPTDYDNAVLAAADKENKVWVRVTILGGISTQASFGAQNQLYRTPGVVEFQIFSPLNRGDKDARVLADRIVPLFRSVTIAGGLRFKTPYVATLGRVEHEWQINVVAPFENDQFA